MIICTTPCFCKAELVAEFLPKFKSLTNVDRHILLLNHWPINELENHNKLIELAQQYGSETFDNDFDRGLHLGFNNWFFKENPPDGTYILGNDADTEMNLSGYDKALKSVLDENSSVKIVAANNAAIMDKINKGVLSPKIETTSLGIRYFIHPSIEMWDVSMYRVDYIRKLGGFNETHAYYGGIESWFYSQPDFKLAYLLDYKQIYGNYSDNCFEPRYRQWKDAHVNNSFKGNFKEFLKI